MKGPGTMMQEKNEMLVNRIKLYAIALIVLPMIALAGFRTNVAAVSTPDDAAATFKAKCAACHTPTVSKFYDPAKSDEEHVQTILKGRKGEKPPYMPAFGEKGITEDQAKELNAYMKQVKTAAK
jgi:mono/diheme cytochrome c family protein